jgi:hypothetical protein
MNIILEGRLVLRPTPDIYTVRTLGPLVGKKISPDSPNKSPLGALAVIYVFLTFFIRYRPDLCNKTCMR